MDWLEKLGRSLLGKLVLVNTGADQEVDMR
jgi:hypothetical protein